MGSTGVKEYTLRINGITQGVKDVTTLEAAVTALDAAVKETNANAAKTTAASKQKVAALTEEEKAAKKLTDTQKRITEVNNEANRAQIAANQELRERTREVTRQVAAEKLAEGSIKAMGMQLTDLRNTYEALSAAERAEEQTGGALLEQIQALDAEYKALRESTGNFRDSVGNYEKAFTGLNELKDRFELAARGSAEMASSVVGTNDVLDAFGHTTDTVAKSSEQLAGIVALATTAQEAYNAVVKEGWVEQKAAAVMDTVRAVQLKAKTAAEAASTKGTIAATIAQRAFNLVANANPYVLLATALISVAGALYLFASRTSDAAEKQKELNDLQSIYLDNLEAEAAKLKEVGDARVKALENQLAVLQAAGAKTKELRDVEDKLARERASNNGRQRGYYADEIANLDKNKKKIEELRDVLTQLKLAQATGDEKIKLDIDLDGKVEKVKIEDAINSVQGAIDNLGRTVKIAVDLQTEAADISQDIAVQNAARIKADKDLAKERAEKAKETVKQRAELELNATRAAEDARIALIENSYDRERATINAQYDRQIQDLKKTLVTEKNLTQAAREAINESIVTLDKERAQALKKISDEVAAKELETYRQLEDQRAALIVGAADRQRAEINIRYDRQIEDLKKRLKTEKDLTENQRIELYEMVENSERQRQQELTAIAAQGAQQRAAQELTALDMQLDRSLNLITNYTGELKKRGTDNIIDVQATRANLAAANTALSEYITGLNTYEADLAEAHETTLNTLKEGTPEYTDEVQKYAKAQEDVTKRIKKAQAEQVENTKTASRLQLENIRKTLARISEWAQVNSEIVAGAVETWRMVANAQVEGLNEQLDNLNDRYEEAKKMREDTVKDVEDLEARLQAATGGTAEALKEQLADSMRARNEAARQEQQLQKEKEKKEAEVRKWEKKMKKADLVSNIAMATANVAQAVTKMLTAGPISGQVLAAFTAALGLVQIGIMTKQLTKLSDGGPIIGPSHEQGGVYIGMGYEAEGGEYMINKRSYAANPGLVEFVNASDGVITAADLVGVIPGDGAPVIISETNQFNEDRIVEAIENINLQPVVAVTDIIDAQDQLTTVQDLAGF